MKAHSFVPIGVREHIACLPPSSFRTKFAPSPHRRHTQTQLVLAMAGDPPPAKRPREDDENVDHRAVKRLQ